MTNVYLPLFVLDPHAEPPFAKCRKLASWNTKFRQSLDGTPDESPATCDMSLASIAAVAGWPDQEIVNLLVANRREKCADPMEEDYYVRIIVQARAPITQAAAQERFEERRVEANDGDDRAERLADLSTLLGLEPGYQILDLVKHVGDPPEYWMETSGGSITLGPVHNIINQAKFIDAVAAVTSIVFVRVPGPAWARRAAGILLCCREVDLGEGSHPGREMAHWLETYLDTQTILEDQNVAAQQGLPFRKDGAVMFALDGFKQYLRFSVGEQLSSHRLGQRLRLCGIEPLVIKVIIKGAATSRNYWRVDNQSPI